MSSGELLAEDLVVALLRAGAIYIDRVMRGEARRESAGLQIDGVNDSSEDLRLLHLLVVGPVPQQVAMARVVSVTSVEDAERELGVGDFDAVVVASEADAERLERLGLAPAVVDLPPRDLLRARVFRALAARSCRRREETHAAASR